MNISCPNCSAVFPRPGGSSSAECPLCLHTFDLSEPTAVVSPNLDLPSAEDDEFESFGAPVSRSTMTMGSQANQPAAATQSQGLFTEGNDDIDFAALLGDVSSSNADGIGVAGADASNLFEDPLPPQQRSFNDDESAFDDDDDEALFVSSPNTSGAAFDEDDDQLLTSSTAARARQTVDAEVQARRKKGDDVKSRRSMAPLFNRLLTLVLLVLMAGIAMDYAGIDVMDLYRDLSGQSRTKRVVKKAPIEHPIPQNLKDPTQILDTATSYLLEIERLKKVLAVRPESAELQAALADAHLDLLERYPSVALADSAYAEQLKALLANRPKRRYPLLNQLGIGDFLKIEELIDPIVKAKDVSADDLGVAAWAMWEVRRAKTIQDALDNPGRYGDPSIDPLNKADPKSPVLKRAFVLSKRALEMAAKANNRVKFLIIHARMADAIGQHSEQTKALSDFVPSALGAYEAHKLLISAHIRDNHLSKAEMEIRRLLTYAADKEDKPAARIGHEMNAWLAQRRGQPDDQIEAMLHMLEIEPNDELTTVRLGRLMLAQRRAQDCQKLLTGAKKQGMKSVAFEVALVELWLWSNRNDDALSEIKEATQRYPQSIDLLFIRGQVEEQQKHTTTAADFYAQVIEKQPDHLRAAIRLSELKSRLGRHEDAHQILANAHSKLGDLPTILEPLARELMALKRLKEARAIFAVLLEQLPNHRGHLLNAARMDLKAGQVDRALKYLKILRDDGVLDQEGAVQMAKALASKGNPRDAAETLVSFADRSPNDIRINALCGQYMLDSGNLIRAETLLKRAYKVAQRQGGDAETMFQYGRLAFKKQEVANAVMRMQEAIKADPTAHQYRYSFAVALLDPKVMSEEGIGALAESNLRFIIDYAPRYAAANNEVDYLADVYRKLAGYYFQTQRAGMAIPLLNQSLSLEPKDVQTKVMLGSALYQVNSPKAKPVLEAILKIQPNNHEAALYLGMTLLNAQNTTEALKWLQRAVRGNSPTVIEAWYHLALIYRDRKQFQKSKAALKTFISRTKPDHPFREDAISQYNDLR